MFDRFLSILWILNVLGLEYTNIQGREYAKILRK